MGRKVGGPRVITKADGTEEPAPAIVPPLYGDTTNGDASGGEIASGDAANGIGTVITPAEPQPGKGP